MSEIKFRAWNEVDKLMVDWSTLKASPEFLGRLLTGKLKHFKPLHFTGFKDANGIDIYEGDIVVCYPKFIEMSYTKIVEWDKNQHSLGITTNGRSGAVLCTGNQDILQVIGNIYQNPELME